MECKCLTKEGVRCSRMAEKGSNFCWQHRNCGASGCTVQHPKPPCKEGYELRTRSRSGKACCYKKTQRRSSFKRVGLEFMPELVQDITPQRFEQFRDLPPELVYNLCQNMDIATLKALVRTSPKYHALCQPVLTKKMKNLIALAIVKYPPVSVGELFDQLEHILFTLSSTPVPQKQGHFWVYTKEHMTEMKFKVVDLWKIFSPLNHPVLKRAKLPLLYQKDTTEFATRFVTGGAREPTNDSIVTIRIGSIYSPVWLTKDIPLDIARYWTDMVNKR